MERDKQFSAGLKYTFLVHFVVAGIFGLVFLLIPEIFGGMMGEVITDSTTYRQVGGALIAFAASSWFAWREKAWERVKIVVQMEIVWTILGAVIILYGEFFERLPAGDWMDFIILAAFAVAFIFFYSRRR